MHKYEQLMDSLDTWGLYQKILCLTVILSVFPVPGLVVVFPLMQKIPSFFVEEKGELVQVQDEDLFCSSQANWDRTIHFEALFTNWSTDLNIVCNRKVIFAFTSTAYFLGSIVSSTSFSKFADRFGRKNIFMLLNAISFVSLIQAYFLFDVNQLLLGSFMQGLVSLNILQGNIMMKEVVDKRYYGLMFSIANAGFPLAGLTSLLLFYSFQNWHVFQGVLVAVIVISNLLAFFFLEESPTWLFANGHYDEFEQVIRRIAKVNNKENEIEETLAEVLKATKAFRKPTNIQELVSTKHVYSYYDLIKYKSIRTSTLGLTWLFVVSGFTFYGLLLNLSGFTGSMFTDAIITYVGEALAEIVSGNLSFKFGRKKTIFVSYILGGIAATCCYFSVGVYKTFSIVMLFLGSIGISAAFNVLYIYAAEVYPTNLRVFSVTYLNLVNRIACSFIPTFLTMFSDYMLPVIAVLSLVAALVMLSLPSTEYLEQTYDVIEIEDDPRMKQLLSSDSDFSSIYLNKYYESN